MKIELKGFQIEETKDFLKKILSAKKGVKEGELQSVLLSAPTGSGKTVMMAQIIENIFMGNETFTAEQDSVILWLSDQPELNEQSRNRIAAVADIPHEKLILVDSNFDQECFSGGNVYFLNTQKLGGDKNLTAKKGDKRSWLIWETIQNTIDLLGDRFYLIIDEAHRGMNRKSGEEKTAKSIVQKFIFGDPANKLKPVPLIIGISATPERFKVLIEGADRVSRASIVDVNKVRESGLLKDRLIVRVLDDTKPSDWTLLAAATKRWQEMRGYWSVYFNENPSSDKVEPVLVVQVEDGSASAVTKTSLNTAVETIESVAGKLEDSAMAHCFQDGTDLLIGARKIKYVKPSEISDRTEISVVFFKTALSTGWDCPRAEVMMSFRQARDATFIAQLIGRMVRTPLANRIENSEVLNEVHLYLPHYNEENLDAVIKYLEGDHETVPATEIVQAKAISALSVTADKKGALDKLQNLPSYVISGRKISNLQRLMRLCDRLVAHNIAPDARQNISKMISARLAIIRNTLLADDPLFKSALSDLSTIQVLPITIENGTQIVKGKAEIIDVSDRNIEDLFRRAKQIFRDDICAQYFIDNFQENAPLVSKLEISLLSQNDLVWKMIENIALEEIQALRKEHHSSILKLEPHKRDLYNEIWAIAKKPEPQLLTIPSVLSFPKESGSICIRHLFSDHDGKFEINLKSEWERLAVETFEKNKDTIAWLRVIDRKPWAICIPYFHDGNYRSMYPDFLLVRNEAKNLVVDIIEPHGEHIEDGASKARGMAEFASNNGISFGRILLARRSTKDVMHCLDFQNIKIQKKALALSNNSELDNLFDAELGFIISL